MEAITERSELTRAAIIGAGIDVAAEHGMDALTLQAVADRVHLSKSGVFSRIGSREALQKAVVDEYGRRFIADVFSPAMQQPKGLPRLQEIMKRWLARMCNVEVHTGCIYAAGAFELDDRECELRDVLLDAVNGWRAALSRTVIQAIQVGHLKPNTDPDQMVSELYRLAIGLLHDARFLRDGRAADWANSSFERLVRTYQI